MNLVKKLFVSISGLFTYLSFPFIAFATPTPIPTGSQATINLCPADATGIAKVVCDLGGVGGQNTGRTLQGIVVFFIILAVVFALIYLLWGGLKWITSRGDKAEVESARNHIIAAVIGLIVVFLAVFILSIVLAALGLNFTQLTIPRIGQP